MFRGEQFGRYIKIMTVYLGLLNSGKYSNAHFKTICSTLSQSEGQTDTKYINVTYNLRDGPTTVHIISIVILLTVSVFRKGYSKNDFKVTYVLNIEGKQDKRIGTPKRKYIIYYV